MNDVLALEDDLEQVTALDACLAPRPGRIGPARPLLCRVFCARAKISNVISPYAHHEYTSLGVPVCQGRSVRRPLGACAQVQTLFWAEGDGLPRPEIAQLCGQLSALLDVMALETTNVIGNYEQAWAASVVLPGKRRRTGNNMEQSAALC